MFRVIVGTFVVLANIAWVLFFIIKCNKPPAKKRKAVEFVPTDEQIKKGYFDENFNWIGKAEPEDKTFGMVRKAPNSVEDDLEPSSISGSYSIDGSSGYESGIIPPSSSWD